MASKDLVIVGDSAFAEIAREYFCSHAEENVVSFAVEREYLQDSEKDGLPVIALEDLEKKYPPESHKVFVAVVYNQLNRLRARLVEEVRMRGYELARYISPYAFVSESASIGEHCFIFENNVIQPKVAIGDNVILWSGNHIGHHSRIEDNTFISSHVVISGFCTIGHNTFIGVNSTLSNNLEIGADNWIGPGITLVKNTEKGAFYKPEKTAASSISAYQFFKLEA